jgi:hypothetical protein
VTGYHCMQRQPLYISQQWRYGCTISMPIGYAAHLAV